jgi:hypothetical protein
MMSRLLFFYLVLSVFSLTNCTSDGHSPKNGNLDKSFKAKISKTEQAYLKQKEKMLSNGWSEDQLRNGLFPDCYNFKPSYSKIKNQLKISVGNGTDVAVKLMSVETDQCIRFVFVNSRSTYDLKKIPEGKYYLKIAYGRDWLSRIDKGKCNGKFLQNPIYEKGIDILDFTIVRSGNSYSIPSFHLQLDVKSTGVNTFDGNHISEKDFNL